MLVSPGATRSASTADPAGRGAGRGRSRVHALVSRAIKIATRVTSGLSHGRPVARALYARRPVGAEARTSAHHRERADVRLVSFFSASEAGVTFFRGADGEPAPAGPVRSGSAVRSQPASLS